MFTGFCSQFFLPLSISHKSIIEFISSINKHFCLINVTFLSLIFSHFFILTWPGSHVVYYMVCILELEDYCTKSLSSAEIEYAHQQYFLNLAYISGKNNWHDLPPTQTFFIISFRSPTNCNLLTQQYLVTVLFFNLVTKVSLLVIWLGSIYLVLDHEQVYCI